jgi:hypothetical protein
MSFMSRAPKADIRPRQIIGLSLSPELASKVKAEAGRRNLSLKHLFEEMWALYEKHGGKKNA